MAFFINSIAAWSRALGAIRVSMEDTKEIVATEKAVKSATIDDITQCSVDDFQNDIENSAENPADNTAEDSDANKTSDEGSTSPPSKPERNSDTDFVLMRQNTKGTATQRPPTKRPAPTSTDTSPKRHKANKDHRDGADKPDEPGDSSGPKEPAQPENVREGHGIPDEIKPADIPDTCYNMGYSMGQLILARADMEVHIDESIRRRFRVTEIYNEALQNFSGVYSVLTPREREEVIAGWQLLFPDTDPPTVEVNKPQRTEDSDNLNEEDDEDENAESQ